MTIEQSSLLAILFAGIPFAILLARENCASRKLYTKLVGMSVLLLLSGVLLSEIGSPQLFGLFVVGWWMMFHAIALRYNDLRISKWKTLWSLIPIVLLFTIFYCEFTKRLEVAPQVRE
jgi:hypothetical protein